MRAVRAKEDENMRHMLAVLMVFALAGCAVQPEVKGIATQYATMKLIERGAFTPEEVREKVAAIRLITGDGQGAALESIRKEVQWGSLDPSDRLLLSALLSDVEVQGGERIPSEELNAILDDVEQASWMY